MCNSEASFVGDRAPLSIVTDSSCLSFSIVGKGELEPRYFRIPLGRSAGFLDEEAADGEMLVSVLSSSWSSCAVGAEVVLEPRYLRMPLGFSAVFLDGETADGGVLTLWRAVDSACWGALGWLVKKCCIDFVPCQTKEQNFSRRGLHGKVYVA